MATNEQANNTISLVTGRGASRIFCVSHPTFHKLVRDGKVTPLGWIETEHGNPIPVFDRTYIETLADQRKQKVA